jgi:hypothetical protein
MLVDFQDVERKPLNKKHLTLAYTDRTIVSFWLKFQKLVNTTIKVLIGYRIPFGDLFHKKNQQKFDLGEVG